MFCLTYQSAQTLVFSRKAFYISLIFCIIFPYGQSHGAEKPILTIYTYESFAAEWGPGPKIEQAFEKICDCDLRYITLADAIGILSRLQLEAASSSADIALGLDQNIMERARNSGLFAPLTQSVIATQKKLPKSWPITWDDRHFIPFDYGYFAFIYDETRLKNVPKSFEDLRNAPENITLLIQDPHSSTPGLGLVLWIKHIYGEAAYKVWQELAPRIVSVTKGWWESYNMFMQGEAKMVLSYTTSPAYHDIVEQTQKYKAASFKEGHYMQIEIAGKLKSSKNPELADQFLKFLTQDDFQKVIPTGNWMYPVIPIALPDAFDRLMVPGKIRLFDSQTLHESSKNWLDEWRAALK